MKRVGVIGAGFGGLALAIRLQAAGIATVLIEKRGEPGGSVHAQRRDGFTFEAGPSLLADPAGFRDLWALAGRDMAADVDLLPVAPFCRFEWPDGTSFDYEADEAAMRAGVARFAPGDLAGYEDVMAYAGLAHDEAWLRFAAVASPDAGGMVKAVPALIRLQAWRSAYARVAGFVKSEKLRSVLSLPTLLAGGNPMSASALHLLMHRLARKGGLWWPAGGMNRLAAAMATLFEGLGGEIRLGDPAVRIHTIGAQAHEIETASGWRERFDAVACGTDLMEAYRALLGSSPRGEAVATRLARKRWSPGIFALHFGVEGAWPGIAPHTILFGPRYRRLLADIFEHGVLPRDLLIHLHHPSAIDPAMAPEGKSAFTATVPVAHLGKLSVDWDEVGPMLAQRVLEEVERRLIPGLPARIVTQCHVTPADGARDLNFYMGSAFGLEPCLTQSGWLRVRHRDDVIKNLYLVGAGTCPGAGIPSVLAGVRAAATLITEDLRP